MLVPVHYRSLDVFNPGAAVMILGALRGLHGLESEMLGLGDLMAEEA
jgi:hypothetical protein